MSLGCAKVTGFFGILLSGSVWGAEGLEVSRLAEASSGSGHLFTELGVEASGVEFVNPIDKDHPTKRLYLGAFACGGVAIGDLDGDGVADLFLTSGPRRNVFYRGLDGMKFQDATADAGLGGGDEWTAGASLVDIDADGDLDVYVCNYDAPNALFINDGKGVFTDKAGEFGLAISDASLMASFCDYDLDGDLDCFLMTRDFKRDGGRPEKHPVVRLGNGFTLAPGFEKYYKVENRGGGKWTYVNAGREDYLFQNDGGKFTDVSKKAGISGRDRGNSAVWWDYDNDGLPDLYVGNDFKDADRLYRNQGDGTFKDVIRQVTPHTPWFSMGADLGDLDGDGREDLLIADMAGTNHFRSKTTMGEMGATRSFLLSAVPRQYMHNVLYLNQDSGLLVDGSFMAGLAQSDWCWAVKIRDFNLDGLPDVYFTNGVSRSFNDSDIQRTMDDFIGQTEWDFYESKEPRRESNLAFVNHGDLTFKSIGEKWGLDHLGMSYAAATGDLDGDGDDDLVVASLDEPVKVYRNDAGAEKKRLVVKLRGAEGNKDGYGATVTVRANGRAQVRTQRPTTGFLSSNGLEMCFGLGESDKVEELIVKWQRGTVQAFKNLKAGQVITVTEPGTKPAPLKPKMRIRPVFVELVSPSLSKELPREKAFDDYARQPLLPYKHSQLGPGMAWGDVDGDGDQDFYLGRPAGDVAGVVLSSSPGVFAPADDAAFQGDVGSEDVDAVFFDADGDGKLDLYVVSGGVEGEPGDEAFCDRLYLGKGDGTFTKATEALPDLRDSGSCVAVEDFDGDGDLDLFVGSRVVPGKYPAVPSSRLLRNDSTEGAPKFVDVTSSVPGLEKAGLVTDALWSDANGDGRKDLVLTCEWGPVKFFLNGKEGLREIRETGVEKYLGWWSGIDGADLDGDGDLDYVVANQGLNTPYKASPGKPELLYYGQMDESGEPRIIEAKFEGKTLYPRRGFSCSSGAMPTMRSRLGTFRKFASSSLIDLYSEENLEKAKRYEANHLAVSVLLNKGNGTFELKELPRWAQLSKANCVLLRDFDLDGKIDCLLGQNFYGPQPEIGHFDMGSTLFLKGFGDGEFEVMKARESGIQIPGAVMSISSVDLNGDKKNEIILGVNNERMRVYSVLPNQ